MSETPAPAPVSAEQNVELIIKTLRSHAKDDLAMADFLETLTFLKPTPAAETPKE